MSKYLKNAFFYHTPSSLERNLYDSNQIKNDEVVKYISNELTELRKKY